MEFAVPESLVYVGSWIAITGGVWALFERAETVISADTKVAISNWLKGLNVPEQMLEWPDSFARVFDGVFGKRHFAPKCFFRSCIASITGVFIITLFWLGLRPDQLREFIRNIEDKPTWVALEYFAPALIVNLIPDYISLLESRYIIRVMQEEQASFVRLFLLVVDVVLTSVVCVFGFFLLGVIAALVNDQSLGFTLREIYSSLCQFGLRLSAEDQAVAPLGIWFYSAFFTSVWVWVYAGVGMAVRASTMLRSSLSRIKRLFDIDAKPLRCLGFVANVLVTCAYVVMAFIR